MFDGLFQDPPRVAPAVYVERRQRAAALWQQVPQDEFDMSTWTWESTACALGWLARTGFDGWRWDEWKIPVGPDGNIGYEAAATYFGLAIKDARHCFGSDDVRYCFGVGIIYQQRYGVTPAEVAATLLGLPIVTKKSRSPHHDAA